MVDLRNILVLLSMLVGSWLMVRFYAKYRQSRISEVKVGENIDMGWMPYFLSALTLPLMFLIKREGFIFEQFKKDFGIGFFGLSPFFIFNILLINYYTMQLEKLVPGAIKEPLVKPAPIPTSLPIQAQTGRVKKIKEVLQKYLQPDEQLLIVGSGIEKRGLGGQKCFIGLNKNRLIIHLRKMGIIARTSLPEGFKEIPLSMVKESKRYVNLWEITKTDGTKANFLFDLLMEKNYAALLDEAVRFLINKNPPQAVPNISSKANVCPKCQKLITPGSAFCGQCGEKLLVSFLIDDFPT